MNISEALETIIDLAEQNTLNPRVVSMDLIEKSNRQQMALYAASHALKALKEYDTLRAKFKWYVECREKSEDYWLSGYNDRDEQDRLLSCADNAFDEFWLYLTQICEVNDDYTTNGIQGC